MCDQLKEKASFNEKRSYCLFSLLNKDRAYETHMDKGPKSHSKQKLKAGYSKYTCETRESRKGPVLWAAATASGCTHRRSPKNST